MNKSSKRIGIDIMGVILPKAIETGTIEEFLACPAIPNAVESIKKLVELYKSENIFIISRCPEFAEKVIMQWFDLHNFFVETGFCRSNIYFCREQAGKAPIAQKLKLTHFIDDRMSVLDFMDGIVPCRIQLLVELGPEKISSENCIVTIGDWASVLSHIINTK